MLQWFLGILCFTIMSIVFNSFEFSELSKKVILEDIFKSFDWLLHKILSPRCIGAELSQDVFIRSPENSKRNVCFGIYHKKWFFPKINKLLPFKHKLYTLTLVDWLTTCWGKWKGVEIMHMIISARVVFLQQKENSKN